MGEWIPKWIPKRPAEPGSIAHHRHRRMETEGPAERRAGTVGPDRVAERRRVTGVVVRLSVARRLFSEGAYAAVAREVDELERATDKLLMKHRKELNDIQVGVCVSSSGRTTIASSQH